MSTTENSLTLEDGLERAESVVAFLWKPGSRNWRPPVLPDEFVGWREEQRAAHETVELSDLSHHMADVFIKGPDAVRMLMEITANKFENFAIGQAKQYICVTAEGHHIGDGIMLRNGEDSFTLTAGATTWARYHATHGDYDIEVGYDPNSAARGGKDPVTFRYQVQGPNALALAETVFGTPIPETKFFHSTMLEWNGRTYRALRHGMSGQAGFEFMGAFADGEALKEAFLEAGENFGLIQVGALAYSTNGIDTGWIPVGTPGYYTGAQAKPFRESLGINSWDAQRAIHGTFFSNNIEDYYVSPWELEYHRSIDLDRDYLGRDALAASKDSVKRRKVTLVVDQDDAARVVGKDGGFYRSEARYRINVDGHAVGMSCYMGYLDTYKTILALSLVEHQHATPGTEVELVIGEHPGPGNDPDGDFGFERVRATVQPAPYSDYAREQYRKD